MKSTKRMRLFSFAEKAFPALFWIFFLFGNNTAKMAVATLISLTVHECGHLFYLFLSGADLSIRATFSGFRIRPKKILSYKEERRLALAGPVSNLLFFLFLVPFPCCRTLAPVSLLTAVSNLIPMEGYDGYRALSAFLSENERTKTLSLLPKMSSAFTVLFLFLSLYFLNKTGDGLFAVGLFLLSLLGVVSKSLKT